MNDHKPQRIVSNVSKTRTCCPRYRHHRNIYTAIVALYACLVSNATFAIETEATPESVYLCDDLRYVDAVVLNYDYRLKIAPRFEITSIVSNLESVLIQKLKSFLTCEAANEEVLQFFDFEGSGDLAVVGMEAGPDDTILPDSICTDTYCEVDVDGALTIYLSSTSDSEMVSYAFLHVIAQTMIDYSDTSIINAVPGLRGASYKGPALSNPRDVDANQMNADQPSIRSHENYGKKGLTKMEVVVLATIVSVVVGLVGAMLLSKRIFISKGDNCFAHCDGTGVDNSFVEGSVCKGQDDDAYEIKSANIQWNVDMHNNLSVIDEDTEAQSTITNHTTITPTKIPRSNDDQSIGSLSTAVTSNIYIPFDEDTEIQSTIPRSNDDQSIGSLSTAVTSNIYIPVA